jgi:hypothetical protein
VFHTRRYNADGVLMKVITQENLGYALREMLVARRPVVTVPLTLPVGQSSNSELRIMAERNKGVLEVRVHGKGYCAVFKENDRVPVDELMLPPISPFSDCKEAIVSEPVIARYIL